MGNQAGRRLTDPQLGGIIAAAVGGFAVLLSLVVLSAYCIVWKRKRRVEQLRREEMFTYTKHYDEVDTLPGIHMARQTDRTASIHRARQTNSESSDDISKRMKDRDRLDKASKDKYESVALDRLNLTSNERYSRLDEETGKPIIINETQAKNESENRTNEEFLRRKVRKYQAMKFSSRSGQPYMAFESESVPVSEQSTLRVLVHSVSTQADGGGDTALSKDVARSETPGGWIEPRQNGAAASEPITMEGVHTRMTAQGLNSEQRAENMYETRSAGRQGVHINAVAEEEHGDDEDIGVTEFLAEERSSSQSVVSAAVQKVITLTEPQQTATSSAIVYREVACQAAVPFSTQGGVQEDAAQSEECFTEDYCSRIVDEAFDTLAAETTADNNAGNPAAENRDMGRGEDRDTRPGEEREMERGEERDTGRGEERDTERGEDRNMGRSDTESNRPKGTTWVDSSGLLCCEL